MPAAAQSWARRLAAYRTPIPSRSRFELLVTALPFAFFFTLSWWSLSISPWLSVGLSLTNAAFVIRLFVIQHDCGHGAFFSSRFWNEWCGRIIGGLTLTPYAMWKRNHALHHATTGNLDHRGTGDIPTLTITEYRAKPLVARLGYRLLRNPLVLFGLIAPFNFLIWNRVPPNPLKARRGEWKSALGTDAAIVAQLGSLYLLGGGPVLAFVYLPMMVLAAIVGTWLFYVQHQFEETYWTQDTNWTVQDASFSGSSHYVLPPVLAWSTGNIGAHHIHHLASRIPFYRLPEVLRDYGELNEVGRITIRQSLGCAKLALWDEVGCRLVSFSEARNLSA
ncbi:fatty acid desaturase [Phaeobacter sp. 22II1-1F12B]|uniref:fatty acid desaturase n=1 Tax=Phaeobacter sp. 22II1-1F12B TaxID=1317111 RepID=UPI000B527C24|nr:fatty acid desaturase [Phaeobacter sp. 22II1-1F12B]OWU68378.1 fatty acid desaturase [Phaeobacter sp. 22II1-1F12B]